MAQSPENKTRMRNIGSDVNYTLFELNSEHFCMPLNLTNPLICSFMTCMDIGQNRFSQMFIYSKLCKHNYAHTETIQDDSGSHHREK